MAKIGIGPLSQRLADDEIADLLARLEKHGAPRLPAADPDDTQIVTDALDDDALAEFLDRLEAHDIACEIYLPMDFEARIEVASLRVGSAQLLLDVLDELRDELSLDDDGVYESEEEDEDEDGDPDDEDSILEAKLRQLWKFMHEGATLAMERHLPLLVT